MGGMHSERLYLRGSADVVQEYRSNGSLSTLMKMIYLADIWV